MRIEEIELSQAHLVAEGYARIVADVPCSFQVDANQFADGVVWDGADNGLHRNLSDQRLLLCRNPTSADGFAHVSIENRDGQRCGVIRFLGFVPGQRRAGQRLLEEAEALLKAAHVEVIKAFAMDYGYPFLLNGTGTLSDRLHHVIALLGTNVYSVPCHPMYPLCQEAFFDYPEIDLAHPHPPDDGLVVRRSLEESLSGLPQAVFRLEFQGTEVGESETWSVGRWTKAYGADQTFLISIEIEEKWQGRGWGRFLLQEAMCQMVEFGYTRASLGTNAANYQAMSLYANLGFLFRGTGVTMTKVLG